MNARRRVHRLVVVGFVVAALLGTAFTVPAAAAPARGLIQVSTDPYHNPDSQHRTQVEPDSFAVGNTIVSAFQVGRFFNGGASNIGFATSQDKGVTWTHGYLPASTVNATPAGPYGRASDASVAYDARDGVWLISYLGLRNPAPNGPVDVVVSRSTDGGLSWNAPATVAATGNFLDKNWTRCDNTPSSPHFGNCYTEFDDNTQGDLEQMSTSTDGGLSWGAGKPTADRAHGLGGQPVIQPNGRITVPYFGLDSPFFFTISVFQSDDGGQSWTASSLISEADVHVPAGKIRAGLTLPSAAVDGSGRIYVTWSDCRFEASCSASDLVLSTSRDGLGWSPVRRIPIDRVGSGVDHFIPGLGVDGTSRGRSAKIGLDYYYYPNANCTPTSCRLFAGFISSTNGGRTWSKRRTLAGPMTLSWLPDTTQGRMAGDYLATSIAPGRSRATPFFALARPPAGTLFDQAIYAAAPSIKGGTARTDARAAARSRMLRPARAGRAPTAQ